MDIGIISVRYAKSLLKYAISQGCEDSVYQEMCTLTQTYLRVPQLQTALQNPVVGRVQALDVLATAFGGTMSDVTSRFIQLIITNGRLDMLHFIARSYLTLYRRYKNVVTGCLTVPTEVAPATLARIRAFVEQSAGGEVDLETRIDPAIGAGFVLEYDTYRLDASLHAQLRSLRKQLC